MCDCECENQHFILNIVYVTETSFDSVVSRFKSITCEVVYCTVSLN